MINNFFNIDDKILTLSKKAEEKCSNAFSIADDVCKYNEEKVLHAFTKCKVSETHFKGSTGYGYNDRGREVLDEVFSTIVGTEDALVRHNFVSGTHALSVALFGILRPNDIMVSLTGKPYDTMEEVIGISQGNTNPYNSNGSLMDFSVVYKELPLLNGCVDYDNIKSVVKDAKVAYIQRSRGYSLRESLTIAEIEKIIIEVKKSNDKAIIIVDNCYGEFVEKKEPTQVGADLIIGSLIKNPGGAIAQTGGYIAGNKDLIELCSYRLTCVGMGKEVGCTLNQSQGMFMGLFFAPMVVNNAVKTSIFACALFDEMGFNTYPKYDSYRTDIIAAIELRNEENLLKFCKGIQMGAPVDSFVTPLPWAMPGYTNDVIMAAGAFNMGASIELSADAPVKEPYNVFVQGGITYNTGKLGVMLAANEMIKNIAK